MRRRLSGAVLTASVLVAAVGCSGSGSGASGKDGGSGGARRAAAVTPERFTGNGDFYAVPDPLPRADHGTLLRYQAIDGVDVAGAAAYRIMYLSESVAGDPVAVTGTVLVPSAAAPEGGRRILTVAHGTSGIADKCAPSKNPRAGELALMSPYLQQGYLVAESDYEGLGTPGRHPYLVGESEGRSVLDAALAARQLPDASAGRAMAIFGYSQGGHGALWAGQLAEKWTPGLRLVGTVAGAPATELPVIFAAGGSRPIAGFLYMIIAGFHQAYPDAPLDKVLTPQGQQALAGVDQGCVGAVVSRYASQDTAALFTPDAATAEPWASLAKGNNPGEVATDTPILIVHSAADDLVPAALSAMLVDRMCRLGQVVERRVYTKGQGHGAAVPDAVNDGFAWIQQRFAGEPATSSCTS